MNPALVEYRAGVGLRRGNATSRSIRECIHATVVHDVELESTNFLPETCKEAAGDKREQGLVQDVEILYSHSYDILLEVYIIVHETSVFIGRDKALLSSVYMLSITITIYVHFCL